MYPNDVLPLEVVASASQITEDGCCRRLGRWLYGHKPWLVLIIDSSLCVQMAPYSLLSAQLLTRAHKMAFRTHRGRETHLRPHLLQGGKGSDIRVCHGSRHGDSKQEASLYVTGHIKPWQTERQRSRSLCIYMCVCVLKCLCVSLLTSDVCVSWGCEAPVRPLCSPQAHL